MRPLSLRTKLVCALAVIVSVAGVPLTYYGYADTLERSVAAAEDKFALLTDIVEEDLGLSYLNGQTLVTEKVAIEKDDIIHEMDAIERALADGNVTEFHPTLAFTAEAWGTHTAIANEWGEFVYLSPVASRMIRENVRDFLGVPFRHYLTGEGGSVYRDHFTFVRAKDEAGNSVPYLLAVRKVSGYTILILQTLDYLEGQEPEQRRVLEGHLRDTVRALALGEHANFAIVSAEGRTVASRGEKAEFLHGDASEALLSAARMNGRATAVGHLAGEARLRSVLHFKPLDWYVHSSVPMSEIRRPAEAYALKLMAIVFGLAWVVAFLGFLAVVHFLRPLGKVSETAKRLEAFDFLSADTTERLEALTRDLPVGQRDEIGVVSRAFSGMVLALEGKIRELKASLAREHSYEGELNAAREIQLGMLPNADEGFRAPGFEAAALMAAAKEVGGDFYDVFELTEGRRALVLGDVSGKGVSAALFMSVTMTLVRNALSDGLTPARAMKKVNDQLAAKNPNCMFVTLWIGILDPKCGRLLYANGGHCPCVRIPADKSRPVEWLRDVSGPLVGVFDLSEFTELETELAPGDQLFVYSDGVSEAMNEERTLFGEAGMAQVFARHRGARPQLWIDAMLKAVIAHRGKAAQSDDITMLVFERTGSGKEA